MKNSRIHSVVLGFAFAVSVFAGVAVAEDTKWGAFAVDTSDGTTEPFYGVGGGDTEKEASDNALGFCTEAGGKVCTLAMTYNQCGALATNGKSIGWGKAPTKEEAEAAAMSACTGGSCEVVSSDCN